MWNLLRALCQIDRCCVRVRLDPKQKTGGHKKEKKNHNNTMLVINTSEVSLHAGNGKCRGAGTNGYGIFQIAQCDIWFYWYVKVCCLCCLFKTGEQKKEHLGIFSKGFYKEGRRGKGVILTNIDVYFKINTDMYILFSGLIIRKTYIHTHHLILKTEKKKKKRRVEMGYVKETPMRLNMILTLIKTGHPLHGFAPVRKRRWVCGTG